MHALKELLPLIEGACRCPSPGSSRQSCRKLMCACNPLIRHSCELLGTASPAHPRLENAGMSSRKTAGGSIYLAKRYVILKNNSGLLRITKDSQDHFGNRSAKFRSSLATSCGCVMASWQAPNGLSQHGRANMAGPTWVVLR